MAGGFGKVVVCMAGGFGKVVVCVSGGFVGKAEL